MAQRTYQIGTAEFGLRTTSGDFCGWIDYALGAYRKRRKTPPYLSVVIGGGGADGRREGKGFHILYRGTTAVVRTLHLPTLARALIAELDSLTFHKREDAIYIQAALVGAGGAIAVAPEGLVSMFGKLGRRVDREGVRLPGTTYLAIDPDSGQIAPVRSTLEIPDDAVARAEEMAGSNGQGDRIFVDAPVAPDMVFKYVAGDSPLLRPVSRGEVLGLLATGAVNLRRMGRSVVDGLARLVEATPCYGLPWGDPKDVLASMSQSFLRVKQDKAEPSSEASHPNGDVGSSRRVAY